MRKTGLLGTTVATAMLIASSAMVPALAQSSSTTPPSATTNGNGTVNGNATGNDNVMAAGGYRTSKIVGMSVYNGQNNAVGTVDDLIVTKDDKVTHAILSVGGFLGVGERLVEVPYNDLHFVNGKITYPGASKDRLTKMQEFHYTHS